jgi:hypothetical protein
MFLQKGAKARPQKEFVVIIVKSFPKTVIWHSKIYGGVFLNKIFQIPCKSQNSSTNID